MRKQFPDIRADSLPVLHYLGTGSHSHVFGTGSWAVKIPRRSLLSGLSLFVRQRRWLHQVASQLGGSVFPFCEIENVAFRAPEVRASWNTGTPVPGTERIYHARRATVYAHAPEDAFLDHQFYTHNAEEAVAMLRQMLDRLETLQDAGFYMLDFIMKNFVFHKGEILILDPGLLVPTHLTRWQPTFAITSAQFRRWLLADYDRLLAAKEEAAETAPARLCVKEFRRELPERVRSLTKRPPAHYTGQKKFPAALSRILADDARRLLQAS